MAGENHKCVNEPILAELRKCIEQHNERLHQGDLNFQELKQMNEAMIKGQKDIIEEQMKTNKRLFVDNGTTSIQTIIDRHNILLKGMMWAITSVSLCTAGVIIKLIVTAVLHGTGLTP